MTRTGGCSKSGLGPGRFPLRCGERSTIAITVAASRAAASASRRGTTSTTGPKGDRPRSPISRCSVADITARCTKRAMASIEDLTARFGSGGQMAGPCRRFRHRPRCPLIRSALSGRVTTCRVCASTRERRARVGSGSAWTWDTRLTSCTRWRLGRRPRVSRGDHTHAGSAAPDPPRAAVARYAGSTAMAEISMSAPSRRRPATITPVAVGYGGLKIARRTSVVPR